MTCFVHICPCCSRRSEVAIRLLGTRVCCRFCRSVVFANEQIADCGEAGDTIKAWIEAGDDVHQREISAFQNAAAHDHDEVEEVHFRPK